MKRFLLDDDGCNLFGNLGDDVDGALDEVVRECSPAVTTYLVCSNSATCFWPTKVGVMNTRAPAVLAAHNRGIDLLGLWLRKLKASGKETFITCRMNDVHNPTETWNTPKLRQDHPDCIVGLEEVRANKAGWMSYCMDYSLPMVRSYVLALIREQIELYGKTIDGIQLDWMRFPRHLSGTPEEVWGKRQIMTDFTAEVRRMLDATGRKILLSARVPTTPAGCRNLGFDLQAWAQQKLIDLLVVCPFLTTDWGGIPVEKFRALVGPEIPVYSGFDLGMGPQVHFPESLRGVCTNLYADKPDGIYVFNWPCWIERMAARPYHWLNGLDDPARAAEKPLLLGVAHKRSRVADVDLPPVIPVTLAPGATASVIVRVGNGALPAWRAMAHAECGGDLTLKVNGVDAPIQLARDYGAGPYRSEVFMEFVNHYRPKTLRAVPADCRQFRVDVSSLHPGENAFVFTNHTDKDLSIQRLNLALW